MFLIPTPYMTDANGVRSDKVSYSLEEIADTSILTVVADSSWIEDSQRVFPGQNRSHGIYWKDIIIR